MGVSYHSHINVSVLVGVVISCAGGCGSMFEVVIDSDQFKGKRLLQQHRMVNDVSLHDIV